MEEKTKTITISSLITLGIVMASMVTPTFFDTDKYVCESRLDLGYIECDSFSKYVAENGKCIRNEDTNLICKTGWVLVENDIHEESEEVIKEEYNNYNKVIVCRNNGKCI